MRGISIQKKWLQRLMVLVITAFTATAALLPAYNVWADNEEQTDGSRREITIEVVEDIPADEIEDADVPLAALPVSEKSNAVRHVGMMLALLGAVCAYSAYFINYEKKLVRLREDAVEAEDRS